MAQIRNASMAPRRTRPRQTPIAHELWPAETAVWQCLEDQVVSRRQFTDTIESGLRGRHIPKAQITIDRRQIRCSRQTRPGEHSLYFGAEQEGRWGGSVV